MLSNPIFIFIRKILRFLKINKLIIFLLYTSSNKNYYEDHFENEMVKNIELGNCVWDVGANIGLYSQVFSQKVGPEGKVFAFEPSEINYRKLEQNIKHNKNIVPLLCGLFNENTTLLMEQGPDDIGATSKVIEKKNKSEKNLFKINVFKGDTLIQNNTAKVPNVIKIDVEGYEYEVMRGLEETLLNSNLKIICIELHYDLVSKRGLSNHPKLITTLLKKNNFNIKWTDFSHIVATRLE